LAEGLGTADSVKIVRLELRRFIRRRIDRSLLLKQASDSWIACFVHP
jgi:hypothetical protein